MGRKLTPEQKSLYKRIDEIVFYNWDPIGISTSDWPRDEYETYVPQIFGAVMANQHPEPFVIGLPSFMKHIKVLEESDLISSRKTGRVRTCQIKPNQLTAAEKWLAEQRVLWEGRTDRLAEYAESLASEEHSNEQRKL